MASCSMEYHFNSVGRDPLRGMIQQKLQDLHICCPCLASFSGVMSLQTPAMHTAVN